MKLDIENNNNNTNFQNLELKIFKTNQIEENNHSNNPSLVNW